MKISKKDKKKKKVLLERSGMDGVHSVLNNLHAKFGKGSVNIYGDCEIENVEVIKTGSYKLNKATIIGGVPRGRIVEVYGPESSGKTTLVLQILANAQKSGGVVAFIDAEHALDPSLGTGVGVDMDKLIFSQPDSGEQALEILEALVRSGEFDVIAVDSVSALVPQAEIDGEMGESIMASQARLMSQAMRKLTSIVSKSNTCVIFINQIRMKIGVVFGNPEVTSGGNALKFYSSLRLEIRIKSKLKSGSGDDAMIIGNKVAIKVVKNKLAPPWKKIETELIFGKGFNIEGELIDIGMQLGIVERKGSSYSYGDDKIGNGRINACNTLRDNQELFENLMADIDVSIANGELNMWE